MMFVRPRFLSLSLPLILDSGSAFTFSFYFHFVRICLKLYDDFLRPIDSVDLIIIARIIIVRIIIVLAASRRH